MYVCTYKGFTATLGQSLDRLRAIHLSTWTQVDVEENPVDATSEPSANRAACETEVLITPLASSLPLRIAHIQRNRGYTAYCCHLRYLSSTQPSWFRAWLKAHEFRAWPEAHEGSCFEPWRPTWTPKVNKTIAQNHSNCQKRQLFYIFIGVQVECPAWVEATELGEYHTARILGMSALKVWRTRIRNSCGSLWSGIAVMCVLSA